MSLDLAPLRTLPSAAADLIAEPGKWTQGAAFDMDTGAMCLTGALIRACSVPGDGHIAREVYRHWDRAEAWNDAHGRTHAEVVEALHREITSDDLAETFGLQWEAIVALVRRAAVLTDDEARKLAAAWDAAWDAAWVAAWDAAWVASRDAAWGAAWDAARDPARDAAWDAAWGAARDAAWVASRDAAWGAAWDAARDPARDAAWDAAWGAARGAAWDAAWGAAWDAAWDAARDPARDAAWDAAWGAARDAARDAAWALVVRDLIGQDGFTQADYDLLTRPWAQVIGPVHPDDKPVTA